MTKALLKNPRTTSDHGDAPHTARPHTITNEPKKKQFLGSESQYEHQPHPNGRADARVHYPVLKPPRTRTRAHPPHQGTGDRHGARNTSHAKRRGVAVREPKSMPAPLLDAPHDRHARRPTPLFHTSNPRAPGTSGARGAHTGHQTVA